MSVTNLNDHRKAPHLSGEAICHECRHHWAVVIPVGGSVNDLECPACSAYKGYLRGFVLYEGPTWHCNCGSDLFRIREDRFYCACCGVKQSF